MLSIMLLVGFLQKIWFWLNELDTYLFIKVNTVWTNSLLDTVYPWWRDANAWIPLYLFLLIFAVMNYRKKAISWILFVVMTLVLTDQVSSTLIKNNVARLRPCQEPFLMGHVRLLLDHCSGGYSFTSSHATNHFGFAMFIFLTLKPVLKKWGWLFFIWAATISYGQVYVGVHYPLDVICGGILGSVIGWVMGKLYNKKLGQLTA